MDNKQKKILVTGANGKLGSQICEDLKKLDYYVIATDSSYHGHDNGVENCDMFVQGNLTDQNFVKVLMGFQTDAIIHCAACVLGVSGFHELGYLNLNDDITMTRNILEFLQVNTKLIFTSSSMVYETCEVHPVKEEYIDNCIVPSTDYGLSKYVNERLIKSFGRNCEINDTFYGEWKYTIWRPFNIINPKEVAYDDVQGYSHVFADFIQKIIIKKDHIVPIIGDGEQVRCFTWHEDVSKFICDNIFNEKTDNETFNVGSTDAMTMKELANHIRDIGIHLNILPKDFPELHFSTTMSYPDDVKKRIPDISKVESVLGWKTNVSIVKMLTECINFAIEQEKEKQQKMENLRSLMTRTQT